jgi:outer membrane immunogenic protein
LKRVIITLLVLAFVSASLAGNDYTDAKATAKESIAPATTINWSGLYVGAQGGYTYGSFDPQMTLFGFWSQLPEDRDGLQRHGSPDLVGNGGMLGGIVGYNYQHGPWVVGLEAAGDYVWLRNSRNVGTFKIASPLHFPQEYNVSSSFKTHDLITLAPRIGYSFGRFLPYVTGGLALGDLDFADQINAHLGFIFPRTLEQFRQGGSHSRTNAGWMMGGGVEYALADHWSTRLQYQYIDLGDIDFSTKGTPSFPAPSYPVTFTGSSKASLTEQTITAALIYKF